MDFTGYRKIASTCPISIGMLDPSPPNALVRLQPRYHHCGVAASEKCLSAATFALGGRRDGR